MDEARRAKARVQSKLGSYPGLAFGIGESDDGSDYAVVVLVKSEEAAKRLPKLQEDVPVKISITGPVSAY